MSGESPEVSALELLQAEVKPKDPGGDGYTVKVAAGRADVVNLMRYNGSTSIGAAQVTNEMVIP